MNCDYEDIRSRIPEQPKWFDEEGVPRYCDFSPCKVANIYADEVALAGITCQGCGTRFKVAFSRSRNSAMVAQVMGHTWVPPSLADQIRSKEIHYGDPPNTGCCPAGPTMNSEPRRVLEYWQREAGIDWKRDPSLEIDIEPDW